MTGHNGDTFREVFVKQDKTEEDTEDKDDDKEKGMVEEAFSMDPNHSFSIINQNMSEPWYASKTLLIITTILAVSLFQKMMVSLSARKYSFHVKKVFFSDPRHPFTNYTFIRNPVVPYTGIDQSEYSITCHLTKLTNHRTTQGSHASAQLHGPRRQWQAI